MGSVDGLRTAGGTLVTDTLLSIVIDLREISLTRPASTRCWPCSRGHARRGESCISSAARNP